MHRGSRCAQPPATRWRGRRAAGGRRGSAGRQGVPVVLPVREGLSGGSYGTAGEGHLLCPAVFPVGVPLAGQGCGSSVDQPEASRHSGPVQGRGEPEARIRRYRTWVGEEREDQRFRRQRYRHGVTARHPHQRWRAPAPASGGVVIVPLTRQLLNLDLTAYCSSPRRSALTAPNAGRSRTSRARRTVGSSNSTSRRTLLGRRMPTPF